MAVWSRISKSSIRSRHVALNPCTLYEKASAIWRTLRLSDVVLKAANKLRNTT